MSDSDQTKAIQRAILNILKERGRGINLFALKASLSEYSGTDDQINMAVAELADKQEITYTSTGISLMPCTLGSYVGSTKNASDRIVLMKFFNGVVINDVPKAEIKDIVRRNLKNRPKLEEDMLRPEFKKYQFTLKSFMHIFEVPASTFIYLKETCPRGKADWRDIRRETERDRRTRDAATELLATEGILIGGVTVLLKVEDIACYLLQINRTAMTAEELYAAYTDFLVQNRPLPCGLDTSIGKLTALLQTNLSVIAGHGKTFRYRGYNERSDRSVVKALKLHKYKNSYISAGIIFQEFSTTLESSNILDKYELVSVLKRDPDAICKYHMTFIRNPFILFGEASAEDQLLSLMKELAPVSGEVLCKEYERRYGLKAITVKLTLMKSISRYLQDGEYDMSTKMLTDAQCNRLKKQLSNDWYFTTEIQQIFKRLIGEHCEEYFSAHNLGTLGYRRTNEITYSDRFSSMEQCFKRTLCSRDTFTVTDALWHQQQVYSLLLKEAEHFEIVEYAPQKFVSIQCLKKANIYKKDLRAFINSVCSYVEDETYFTLKSLEQSGFLSQLDHCGFEDTFYFSLLKQSKAIQARKVGSRHIFRKSKQDATLPDFIEYLITGLHSIDIYEFSDFLNEQYGIDITPLYIRTLIKQTQLFYAPITEKIYVDYDEYFEEV